MLTDVDEPAEVVVQHPDARMVCDAAARARELVANCDRLMAAYRASIEVLERALADHLAGRGES